MEQVPAKEVSVSYKLAPGDKLFYCPYNRSHQVLEFKAAKHLETCRKAYLNIKGPKGDKIVRCRWLPTKHHLPESQLAAHEKICEGNNEEFLRGFSDAKAPTLQMKTPVVGSTSGEMDYWEDD